MHWEKFTEMLREEEEPGKAGTEYFRGEWDIPLNSEGLKQVKVLAKRNRDRFDDIFSGTQQRHKVTALAFASQNPDAAEGVRYDDGLNPMCVGKFEGEPVTSARVEEISHQFHEHPEERIPGIGMFSGKKGDVPELWIKKFLKSVKRIVDLWKPGRSFLVVTSGRDTQLVRAWVKAGMDDDVDMDLLCKRFKSRPGDMLRLNPDTASLKDVPREEGEGIYFMRHGETDANLNTKVPEGVKSPD
jgi:broad specificity phosphatase PhoE